MIFSSEDILFEATNPNELHLIVIPTEKCNFRCKYCYEDHKAPQMTAEVQNSLIRYIGKQLPKLSHFTIHWFGGEPLLGLPVIRRVNGAVLEQLRLGRSKAWFRSGITTNGYLLRPELFDELLGLGVVQYQITLDGPKEIHDSTRIRTDGGGSFDQIWSNLLSMHERAEQFDVLLRLHLMNRNIDRVHELIDILENGLGEDKRFKFFLKPIKNLGGDSSGFCAAERLTDGDELAESLQKSLKTSRSFWSPNPICHASKFNSLIIRADGRIAKCTTALNDPINTIGKIREDGCLELDRTKVLKWSRGVFDMNPDRLYCPYGGIHNEEVFPEAAHL